MDTNYFLYAPGEIIQSCGGATALVFGAVYYLSKRDGGYCWASQTTIGQYVKLTDRSVRTHLRKLLEGGYIEELPHGGDTNGYRPTYVWVARTVFEQTPEKISEGVGKNFRLTPEKISDKEKSFKSSSNLTPDPSPSRAWVEVLSKACGMDYSVSRVAGRLARRGKELHQAGYVPDDVEDYFMPAWYEDDWRGKKGQLPTPENIVEKMGYYKSEYKTTKQREYENELKAKGYV